MSISTTTVGLDIGYGNLKAIGRSGTEPARTVVLPVGSAPLDQAPKTMNGAADLRGGEQVLVNGAAWVAGIDPVLLQSFARQTHATYTSTPEYLALYFAALARLGYRQIDHLVTGLPCSQYLGPKKKEMRKAIAARLRGDHWINSDFRCEVKNVYVIAQPVGSYRGLVEESPNLVTAHDQMVLIIDAGYYSVDWVLMHGRSLRDRSSGSSTMATSTILEQASTGISTTHNGAPLSPARLESVYRRGESVLQLGQHTVPYRRFLDSAAMSIGRSVMAEVSTSLRREKDGVDIVMLTGGGARLYEQAAREGFADSRIIVGDHPVLSNAKGYQIMARDAAEA